MQTKKDNKFNNNFFLDGASYEEYMKNAFRYHFVKEYLDSKFVILDVACGSGYGTEYLSRDSKLAVGVDLDIKCLKYAKQSYKSERAQFICADGRYLPFKREVTDVVVSFETIEHIEGKLNSVSRFIKECNRIKKEDGLFICSTPNKLKSSPLLFHPRNPYHIREFTPNSLTKLLKKKFIVTLYMQPPNLSLFQSIYHSGAMFPTWLVKLIKKTPIKIVTKFIRSLIINDKINSRDTISEKIIVDDILDDNYKVKPFKSSIWSVPDHLIAICRNN